MNIKRMVKQGAIAGITGGAFFIIILVMGNMLPTLGSIINWPTPTGGLVVHVSMSIVFGIAFALIFDFLINSWGSACVIGVLFGLGAWVGGPLLMLPLLANGEPLFSHFDLISLKASIKPLVGHLIFGFVMGATYYFQKSRNIQDH